MPLFSYVFCNTQYNIIHEPRLLYFRYANPSPEQAARPQRHRPRRRRDLVRTAAGWRSTPRPGRLAAAPPGLPRNRTGCPSVCRRPPPPPPAPPRPRRPAPRSQRPTCKQNEFAQHIVCQRCRRQVERRPACVVRTGRPGGPARPGEARSVVMLPTLAGCSRKNAREENGRPARGRPGPLRPAAPTAVVAVDRPQQRRRPPPPVRPTAACRPSSARMWQEPPLPPVAAGSPSAPGSAALQSAAGQR